MKCLTGQRVLQSANVSVASVPSFPYRSRGTSRTSRGEYISRTDRTVRKQWPYDQPAGEGADALALQRRFADGNSLFVVMARDEASSIASNLARFYGRVARNTRNETAPYSERALELELTQQAMSYSNVEALARAVPCGRLMALPFELFLVGAPARGLARGAAVDGARRRARGIALHAPRQPAQVAAVRGVPPTASAD